MCVLILFFVFLLLISIFFMVFIGLNAFAQKPLLFMCFVSSFLLCICMGCKRFLLTSLLFIVFFAFEQIILTADLSR